VEVTLVATAPDGTPAVNLPSPAELQDRLEAIRGRVEAAGGAGRDVEIVAVTKGLPMAVVELAAGAGLVELGENHAQELVAKATGAPSGPRWHLLGPLQRRRTRSLAPHVSVWEAIDRPEAADAVAGARPGALVYVQVNLTGDPAKHGCSPREAPSLVTHCRDTGLDVVGLMTVGPAGDRVGTRACFSSLAALAADLGVAGLSMGMSDDFELAVEAGATSIRLGRALFGPRPGTRRAPR
jgi:pyridoxal phosphate enzyme (YggS family)